MPEDPREMVEDDSSGESSEEIEEETGRIVEFPPGDYRIPPTRLPRPVGRIAPGHPLQRPLTISIILLALLLLVYIVVSFFTAPPQEPADDEPITFSEMYRESGAITYQDEIVQGWFLDAERQHFMTEDGRRFTYVDPHTREGDPVSGYWRLSE